MIKELEMAMYSIGIDEMKNEPAPRHPKATLQTRTCVDKRSAARWVGGSKKLLEAFSMNFRHSLRELWVVAVWYVFSRA